MSDRNDEWGDAQGHGYAARCAHFNSITVLHSAPATAHFIKSILEDEKNLAIVKTIISTAKIFGLKTLAEGIETQEIATLLAELGCDWGQGYYFDKPLSVEQFEKLLLSYKREYWLCSTF